MRRVALCIPATAFLFLAATSMSFADLTIEAENANALDHAIVMTGQGTPSGGAFLALQNPWDQPGSSYYWLDAGTVAPGKYSLTLNLWSENIGRWVYAEMRQGTHLAEDGNWGVESQFAIPTSGQSAYDPVICTTEWNAGDTSLFTINPGQDYTLCVRSHPPGGDMVYFDKLTLNYVSAVPEPSVLVMTVVGTLGLMAYAWRKRR